MKGFNSSCGSPTSVNNFISVEQGGKKKKKKSKIQCSNPSVLLDIKIVPQNWYSVRDITLKILFRES